jgi:hypothetical protein
MTARGITNNRTPVIFGKSPPPRGAVLPTSLICHMSQSGVNPLVAQDPFPRPARIGDDRRHAISVQGERLFARHVNVATSTLTSPSTD